MRLHFDFCKILVSLLLSVLSQDAYQLALELEKAWNQSVETGTPMDIESPLKR